VITRCLRGLLALVTIAALTVGVPWALSATVGNPLHQWSGIRAGDMSDTDVIAIVAAITYLVWATFVLALLIEAPTQLAAVLSRRPARTVRIPLLGWQQGVARTLITSVLMILPVALTTFGPATAASARTPAAAAVVQQHTSPSSAVVDPPTTHKTTSHVAEQATPQRSYVVPDHGGLTTDWAVAEHYLDAGTEWRQIATLNEGRTQPDGHVMTSSGRLLPGWSVLLPDHAKTDTRAETVAPKPHPDHPLPRRKR
jgi:hypothetical protein